MNQFLRRVAKKSEAYEQENTSLLVEKANLHTLGDKLFLESTLSAGRFYSTQRYVWMGWAIIAAVFASAVLLNVFSITTFLEQGPMLSGAFHWVMAVILAVVLTGGGLIASSRLSEAFFAGGASADGTAPLRERASLYWGLLLLAIEVTLLCTAEVRAGLLAAHVGSTLLYAGYLLLSILLPLIAGMVHWDVTQYLDVYKNTLIQHKMEGRLSQIDVILQRNDKAASDFYAAQCLVWWDRLSAFKTAKTMRDAKHGAAEDLRHHFARSFDAFMHEANRRYGQDIIETAAEMASPTLEQTPADEQQAVHEVHYALLAKGDGSSALEAADVQLAPGR